MEYDARLLIVIVGYLIVIISFGLANLAKSQRALGIAAFAIVVIFIVALLARTTPSASGPPTSIVVVSIILFPSGAFLAGVSASFGVATRAFGLWLRHLGSGPRAVAAPTIAGFVLLNAAFFGVFVALPAHIERPPSEACLGAVFKVEVGGQILTVPAAPEVTIHRSVPSDYSIWPLAQRSDLRELCAMTADGANSFWASDVTIRVHDLDGFTRRERRYCEMPAIQPWSRAICENDGSRPENWPHEIFLGDKDGRGSGFPMLWGSDLEFRMQGLLNNSNVRTSSVGPFKRYQVGNIDFWTSDDPELALPDGTRFVAECFAGCTVMFNGPANLRAAYEFYLYGLNEEQMVERIRSTRSVVLEIVASLVDPPDPF